jgi:hypothetical protein
VDKQLVTLTPLEPWFFGTDRTLAYPDGQKQHDGGYFIRSLDAPSQTTLFGVLRYLGIENPNADFSLSEDDKVHIGVSSFRLGQEEQSFGEIRGISPLYLLDTENIFYVPLPFDHDGSDNKYSPFKREDCVSVQTNCGERLLPQQYSEKNGLTEGWLRLSDKTFHTNTNLFQAINEVGINIKGENDALFKRERKIFHPEIATNKMRFAFFADAEFDIPNRVVYLGQQKSAFLAQTEKLSPPVIDFLDAGVAYAQSDLYVQKPDKLYAACESVISKITEVRHFSTNYESANAKNRYSKGCNLLRLIKAGSVFRPKDTAVFKQEVKNPHAETAGFNHIIIGGGNL